MRGASVTSRQGAAGRLRGKSRKLPLVPLLPLIPPLPLVPALPRCLLLLGPLLLGALGGCALRAPERPQAPPAPAGLQARGGELPPAAAGAAAESFAAQARALIGEPYRYGGSAPGGFDCSGLVQYAAHAVGLTLPRTAEEQLHTGVPVPPDRLRSGDLVFLHLATKELHVGVALDRTHFVHAPSRRGRVRVDSLAAEPYASGFFAARRVLTP